jgi:multidrug transporter EmrE-like cation transporter
MRIFAGAIVPVLAHAVEHIGVGHAYPVFYPALNVQNTTTSH